jgi:signal transduction histidine kinase
VRLDVALDGDTLVIEVHDDGVGGVDPARGTGLTGLVDRVEAAGGVLVITSPAGEGTTLRAVLPVGPGRRPEPAGGRVPGRR